MGLYGFFEFFK
uniref:Uncharacterized protein n=1 Tax=Lepeophtheirus salmonis TaxID=72036 RepID=A0A0K2V8T7_LEPSM